MQQPTTTANHRYAALDGVRGLAILLVLLSHLQDAAGGPFVGLGQFGVWLFFALSSFLLSLYFFEHPSRIFSAREWANYSLRRFLRIYPLFTLATIGGVFAGWWGWAALKSVLLLRYPGWWAIFVEFRFYFVLPFVVAILSVASRISRLLPWMLLVLALALQHFAFPAEYATPGYEPDKAGGVTAIAYEYMVVFFVGCFAAWALVTYRDRLTLLKTSRPLDVMLAVGFALPFFLSGGTLATLLQRPIDLTWYHMAWTPFGVYFAVLIYGVMVNDGYTRRILASAPFRFLGLISYSLYMEMDFLIRPVSVWAAHHHLSAVLYLSLIPITAIAYVSFRLIECPLSKISLVKPRGHISRELLPRTAPGQTHFHRSA